VLVDDVADFFIIKELILERGFHVFTLSFEEKTDGLPDLTPGFTD
jgi:hypothetical protein